MKYYIILPAFLLWSIDSISQKVFFTSKQQFSKEQLSVFYSSISVSDNRVLFNAADHKLYLYDKQGDSLLWTHDLKYKSNVPPLLSNSVILVTGNKGVLYIDANSGAVLKKLAVSVLETTPQIRNGIIYGTGILDGGCVFAYRPGEDTVQWKRFIAHGSFEQPYYFDKGLFVNMEGDQWFEMGYNGVLPDPLCQSLEHPIPGDLPCVKESVGFTHDKYPITRKLAEKLFYPDVERPQVIAGNKYTCLYYEEQLVILGNKLKRKISLDISSLLDSIPYHDAGLSCLLKAGDNTISLMHGGWFLVYDHKANKLVTALDLSSWQPHQVIADDRRLWMISGKDGLLYGLHY
jgi:hypothetical protein